jgi:uncharacterized protein with HEPN domain
MSKDPTIAIRDCLAEIKILHEIAARMTLEMFRMDPIVRRAAAYAIQSISEAVRYLPDDWLADFPTEPWEQIKGIGNRIRHEYFRLDDAILWEIIATDTHALKVVMEAMLVRHEGRGRPVSERPLGHIARINPPWPAARRMGAIIKQSRNRRSRLTRRQNLGSPWRASFCHRRPKSPWGFRALLESAAPSSNAGRRFLPASCRRRLRKTART